MRQARGLRTETPPDEGYYEAEPDESRDRERATRTWLYPGPSFIIPCLDSPVRCSPMRRALFALLICALVMPAAEETAAPDKQPG